MKIWVVATVLSLGVGGAAMAQAPLSTAPVAAAPQPAITQPGPLSLDGPATAQGAPVAMGPCGPEKVKPDGRLETAPHGEVEAGVGTGGYRHIAGAVCQPIGQEGFVAVGVSDTQFQPGGRRH